MIINVVGHNRLGELHLCEIVSDRKDNIKEFRELIIT